jgi:hypothetical protein
LIEKIREIENMVFHMKRSNREMHDYLAHTPDDDLVEAITSNEIILTKKEAELGKMKEFYTQLTGVTLTSTQAPADIQTQTQTQTLTQTQTQTQTQTEAEAATETETETETETLAESSGSGAAANEVKSTSSADAGMFL